MGSTSKKVTNVQKVTLKPDNDNDDDLAAFLPSNKIKDFGVHRDEYYPLQVSFFKNKLDGAILEALSKKIGQSELFSYQKTIENAVLTRNQVANQTVKNRQVQKLIENYNVCVKSGSIGSTQMNNSDSLRDANFL